MWWDSVFESETAIEEATRMVIASSKATNDGKVVVSGPFARYSRIKAKIAAGAVVPAVVPITNHIGK